MESIRVYVNGAPVDVHAGETAEAAVRTADPAAADELRAGSRIVVDNRGLPIPADSAVYQGAIFRVVSARQARDTSAPASETAG